LAVRFQACGHSGGPAILPAPVDAPVVAAVEDESSADDAPLVIATDDLIAIDED
jgi:hypothetical protein